MPVRRIRRGPCLHPSSSRCTSRVQLGLCTSHHRPRHSTHHRRLPHRRLHSCRRRRRSRLVDVPRRRGHRRYSRRRRSRQSPWSWWSWCMRSTMRRRWRRRWSRTPSHQYVHVCEPNLKGCIRLSVSGGFSRVRRWAWRLFGIDLSCAAQPRFVLHVPWALSLA
jgi:hypothetical protein